ncbi:MAG TPA: protease modulator HflC [Beijerinckiaceae bacterium]|nr:protease modulator HflC [Beijerinckiaceae bacterium]
MKNPIAAVAALAVLVVVLMATTGSMFTVSQTEQAVVLRFGEPVPGRERVTEPGLHFKVPFVESVVILDKRLLDLETPQQEVLTHDNQRLLVDAFMRYRIVDPLKFYQTVRTVDGGMSQLQLVLNSTIRRVLGDASITDVVRDKREDLMAQIRQLVNSEADRIGVAVADTRIRRADFPKEISAGVFGRMQTERQREAAEYRAQGSEQAQTIRAKADRDVTVLVAQAQQQADTTRGAGDAERNQVFNEAFGQDPDFFAFYRSMQAYQTGLKPDDTRLILTPDSNFFRFFGDPSGTSGQPDSSPQPSPPQPQAKLGDAARPD